MTGFTTPPCRVWPGFGSIGRCQLCKADRHAVTSVEEFERRLSKLKVKEPGRYW